MKVYVITEGDYSDYHIIGVTLDKATAMKYVELHTSEDDYFIPRIEEYDSDTISYISKEDMLGWLLSVNREGLVKCDRSDLPIHYPDCLNKAERWGKSAKEWRYVAYVSAENKDKACKIGLDLIAQFKAKKKGVDIS